MKHRKGDNAVEDQAILQLFLDRSELAIEEAQKKYTPPCRVVAMNLLGDPHDTEECLNDTWHALWNAIPPQRPENLGAFAVKITRNLAMKQLTRQNAEKRQVVTLSYDELRECLPASASPEELLEGRELAETLNRFLSKLDRNSRDLFLRRYWFFDSVKEIAHGFGISETRVTTKLHRIRKKLKDYLAKEAGIYVR